MIKDYLDRTLTVKQKEACHWTHEVTQGLIKALENSVMNNQNSIGLPYWSAKNPLIVRDFTFVLSALNLATVSVSRKFSKLEFNLAHLDPQELKQWRFNSKLEKFMMRKDLKEYASNLVKVNGKEMVTGLDRKGFAKVAKNSFKLDTVMLGKYARPIKQNLIKSITKALEQGKIKDKFLMDKANFQWVVDQALLYYMSSPEMQYNLEKNVSDQRGRSIYKALKRIGNPISSKDFRALLVVPNGVLINVFSKAALDDIYYFVAELIGSKASTE